MQEFMKALEKGKMFLMEPTKSFKSVQKASFGDAFRYFLLLAIVSSVLSGIIAAPFIGVFAIVTIISTYIFFIVGLFIGGVILHIFAWLFGARKGFEQTLKTVAYASTPGLLFMWLPIIGWLISLYTIVLEILGLKNLQGMSTERAALAVLVPIILLAIAVAILFFMAISFLAATGGLGAMPFDMTGYPF